MNGNWRDDEEKVCVSWRVAVPLVDGILNIESVMTVAKSDLGYKVPIGTYKVLTLGTLAWTCAIDALGN